MISRYIKSSLAGALLLMGGAAQAADIQGMQFQDWGGNCVEQVCYLQQILSKGEAPYMVTVIGYAQGKPYPTVIFELPASAQVQDGVTLQVDNKPPINFAGSCEDGVCRAGFALDPRMMQQFKKGRQATVTFSTGQDGATESLPLSLMGVTKGLNALR